MIQIKNVGFSIAGREILRNISFQIAPHQKCALVGLNGSGKTTLLDIISKRQLPDQGDIDIPKDYRIANIEQGMPISDKSLIDYVLSADQERLDLLAKLNDHTVSDNISEIMERLEHIDAYTAPSRAAKILSGLGFPENQQVAIVNGLSGGWRMRLSLARALFLKPDILILDEPTNHLDLESGLWLIGFLMKYPGIVLFTSHDRDLLSRLPTRIFELESGNLKEYTGNYDTYCRAKAENLKFISGQREKQDKYKEKLGAFILKYRSKKSTARQVQSRIKALEKLKEIDLPPSEGAPSFDFSFDFRSASSPLIKIDVATIGYGEKVVLSHVGLSIGRTDRIALVGRNGNGKSTLLKALAGALPLLSGERLVSQKLSIGYLDQSTLEDEVETLTSAELFNSIFQDLQSKEIRSHLARFGVGEKIYNTPISQLSGGERARVAFARLALQKPQLLLLDEPTNHLDIQSRESLALALNDYKGAVVFVTHDASFAEKCADELVLVDNQRIHRLDVDIPQYAKQMNGVNLSNSKSLRLTPGSR